MNITGANGDGTTSLTIHTDQILSPGDWVLLNYNATTAANGVVDATGNVMMGDAPPGFGGSAEGSSLDNIIDLSNSAVFSATGGYDISGGLGNDTITGSAAFDWIMGGAGADILTGGTASGDHFNFVQDGSSLISYNGSAYTAANGLDRITDFSSNDALSLNVVDNFTPGGSMPNNGLGMMAAVPMDGLAADQSYFLVQGNYSAGQFTVNAMTGTDTMVVYDSDATAAVAQSGVVLSGVTVGQLGTMAGSNYVSYMGGGVTPPPPIGTGFTVTLDTNPGDTLIGTFSPYLGSTVALHDRTGPDGIIDSMDVTDTWTDMNGQPQSSTATFAVQWDMAMPTNWMAYRVDTLAVGTTYDAFGRPLTLMTQSGAQTITWLATPVNNMVATLSFMETWNDGSQHTVDVSLFDMNNDGMPDEIQIVNDANTAMSATTLMQVTGATTDQLGRPTSMTAQVFSSTSGDGILQGSATFSAMNVIQSVTLAQGGGTTPPPTGDTVPPMTVDAWADPTTNSFGVVFSENIMLNNPTNLAGVTAYKNGVTQMTLTSATVGTGMLANEIAMTYSDTLVSGDFIVLAYDAAAAGNNITDLAGNPAASGVLVDSVGLGGAAVGATVDASTLNLPAGVTSVMMRGNAGVDNFTGTNGNDTIMTGRGADTITGGGAQDYIYLSESTAASDTVVINVGDSTPAGGAADLVYGFDVTSAGAQDMLNLPSNIIAADTFGFVTGTQTGTIMAHSITGGMISFSAGGGMPGMPGMPVWVGDATNWFDVKNYMAANIIDGQTVATYIDMNGNNSYADAVDRLAVFQGNATTDIQVQLYDTMGMVTSLANTLNGNSVTII